MVIDIKLISYSVKFILEEMFNYTYLFLNSYCNKYKKEINLLIQ